MLGLALVASLALSVIGAASASAAAPTNTAIPVITPPSPHYGTVETTTTGTWTGSPTSYKYTWYRCTGVSCVPISGATGPTYTVLKSDWGRTFQVAVEATNSEGSASALSAPTKQTTPPPAWSAWYVNGVRLAEETPTEFTMVGAKTFIFKWSANLVQHEIRCSTQTIEVGVGEKTTVVNPAGDVAGTANLTKFILSGCTVSKPANCTFPAGKITIPLAGAQTTEFEGKRAVKFNQGGTSGFEFGLSGENCPYKGQTLVFVGGFTGIGNSATSSLEFTSASSDIKYAGVAPVSLEGQSAIKTTTGLSLTLGV